MMSHQVITAVEISAEDYASIVDSIRVAMKRVLAPHWTFMDSPETTVVFNNVKLVVRDVAGGVRG